LRLNINLKVKVLSKKKKAQNTKTRQKHQISGKMLFLLKFLFLGQKYLKNAYFSPIFE